MPITEGADNCAVQISEVDGENKRENRFLFCSTKKKKKKKKKEEKRKKEEKTKLTRRKVWQYFLYAKSV